jgi:hypothetical protein
MNEAKKLGACKNLSNRKALSPPTEKKIVGSNLARVLGL